MIGFLPKKIRKLRFQRETGLDEHLKERQRIAKRYLSGRGIEIGALHSPIKLPKNTKVQYLDRLDVDNLRKQYPELCKVKLVHVDIIDDGEKLQKVNDQSQDFIIANHFIEHCENPILSFLNFMRVIRAGGILYLSVPDKRFSFDQFRSVTTWDHLYKDFTDGPDWSRRMHLLEWVRYVQKLDDPFEIEKQIQNLLATNYSIHYHVWTQTEAIEAILSLKRMVPFEILLISRNINEIIFVLCKP